MGSLQWDLATARYFQLDDDGRLVWATDAPPARLLPAANTLSWSGNIDWPDWDKGNVEYYRAYQVEWAPGQYQDTGVGQYFARVKVQKWGPDEPAPYNLPRILIGAAPAACNYLDVATNLTNTKAPDLFFYSNNFRYGYPEGAGKYARLDGGCVVLEKAAPWIRMIRVVLIDGSVWLERHQSVAANPVGGTCITPIGVGSWKSGAQSYDGSATSNWSNRWTDDGDRTGWVAYGFPTAGGLYAMRGGSNQPSSTDVSDFSSTWTGSIVVRPGHVKPA